jgi:aminotransferase
MTGWRVGYLAAPKAFVRRLIDPRHMLSINTATPSQFAALAALTGPQEPVEEMRLAYAERRALMMRSMDDLGLSYGYPGGAFYLYANTSGTGMRSPEFCETLLREGRVMLFPGSLFGDDSDLYTRMSYLQPIARIEEAMDRLAKVVAAHRSA